MIAYKCDACKTLVDVENIFVIAQFPRRLRTYAKDAIGCKLIALTKEGFAETHLCTTCYR